MTEAVDRRADALLLAAPGPVREALADLLRTYDHSVLIDLAQRSRRLSELSGTHPNEDQILELTLRARSGRVRGRLKALISLPER